MKFLHLSDLHIGLKLYNYDLMEDQRYIFNQIAAAAKETQPDAVVIAGDIYDKAIPSAEAVGLFDEFVQLLTEAAPDAEVMMISGNHDSAPRLNTFRSVLRRQKVHMVGLPPAMPEDHIEKVTLTDEFGKVNFYLLPFIRPSSVKQIIGTDENGLNFTYNETLHRIIARENIIGTERNVLVSHQFYLPAGTDAANVERMESEVRTIGNIDEVKADILERFDYAALGHIHKPMRVGRDIFRYPGTPLACSLSEAGQQKGILLVEMKEKGNVSTTVLPLTPLREVKEIRGSLEEVLGQSCGDYVRVTLTDKADLDVIDMQDRIRLKFPRLLEIRRDTGESKKARAEWAPEEELNPFEICSRFLPDLMPEEQALLRDVINELTGGEGK